MITTPELVCLVCIALLGHAMALLWYVAVRNNWKLCERTIYLVPIDRKQMVREMKNSVHTPIHAVILAAFLYWGFFRNTSWTSFFYSVLATTIWAELWHYGSHRAFHLGALHWIHLEHHKSRLNSPFTAISFAFSEKLIFDVGLLVPLAVVDHFLDLNFFGVATWFIGYLIVNSFSHANFEIKSIGYNRRLGKIITSATYHALHHSRYTGNYGLGTRVLDRLCKTEWEDYEALYDRVPRDVTPLRKLREKILVSKSAA
jgi:Delta7-sterol 5-desaturase